MELVWLGAKCSVRRRKEGYLPSCDSFFFFPLRHCCSETEQDPMVLAPPPFFYAKTVTKEKA